MEIEWFPQHLDSNREGDVREFIRKDLEKYFNLRMRVRDFLKKLGEVTSLQPFFDSKEISLLSKGLYEMRIPQRATGGVVRIYFCFHPKKGSTMVLLDAELKKRTEAKRIENARKKMKILFDYYNRGEKYDRTKKR